MFGLASGSTAGSRRMSSSVSTIPSTTSANESRIVEPSAEVNPSRTAAVSEAC